MDFVDGVVLDQPDVLAALDAGRRRPRCEQLVDTLVALHAVDPAAVGLADFGRPDGLPGPAGAPLAPAVAGVARPSRAADRGTRSSSG